MAIADIIIFLSTALMAGYCQIIAYRVRKLQSLDTGIGAEFVRFNKNIEDVQEALKKSIATMEEASSDQDHRLKETENSVRKLELLLASVHDIQAEAEATLEAKHATA